MTGLIPFNKKTGSLIHPGFEDFYNMLDDFFNDSWTHSRVLSRDTFKIDVKETDAEYIVEAELPGVNKDEIDISSESNGLVISVNRYEEVNDENKNYIHRERRASSMSRGVRLVNAKLDDTAAKLENGILTLTVPKQDNGTKSRKISIE